MSADAFGDRETPMQRDEVIAKLKQHETELRRLGVERLYLFGSTARGEAREDSDVDLFFDYEKGKLGLYELMDVKEETSRILGRKADIMTRDSLHKVCGRGSKHRPCKCSDGRVVSRSPAYRYPRCDRAHPYRDGGR